MPVPNLAYPPPYHCYAAPSFLLISSSCSPLFFVFLDLVSHWLYLEHPCNHGFGVICSSQVGSVVGTQQKKMPPPSKNLSIANGAAVRNGEPHKLSITFETSSLYGSEFAHYIRLAWWAASSCYSCFPSTRGTTMSHLSHFTLILEIKFRSS